MDSAAEMIHCEVTRVHFALGLFHTVNKHRGKVKPMPFSRTEREEKMLPMLIFSCLQFQALASLIHGFGNTVAEYGGEASYSCSMDNPTAGLLQVTWQRGSKDGPIENLATYSKRFGQKVNVPYHGKVTFREASLNSTSISLSNVSWQDESCYICSFNVFPEGSKRWQTCLSVQGISSVATAFVPRGAQEVECSCSALGKPAPTIQWDVAPGAASVRQSQSATVTNSDHTFTSSSNITLQVPAGWRGHVDCLLNMGQRGQRRERIPFTVGPQPPKEKDENTQPHHRLLAVVIITLCIIPFIAAAAVVSMRKGLMCKGFDGHELTYRGVNAAKQEFTTC